MVLYCVYTQDTTSIKNTLRCLLDLCFPDISLIIASELKVLHGKHRQCKHPPPRLLIVGLEHIYLRQHFVVGFFFCFFFVPPILVACEELRLSCRSPSSLARRASWLIIITTSLRCLVQLGQTQQRKRWPLFFVLLDIKLSGRCQI